MSEVGIHERYRDLQAYVGWNSDDATRVNRIADYVKHRMHDLIDDFYAEIERHPDTIQAITAGRFHIDYLKASLREWLQEALDGGGDADYVARRWRIGLRHAEIGLNPAYTTAAMSRLRNGLVSLVAEAHHESPEEFLRLVQSLNKLLDVDLAIIQDAYQAEYSKRERLAEHERSEIKFRILVEAAACMVIILRADDTIAYFSPYSEELTGYMANEVIGQQFLRLFVPEWARDDVAAAIAASLAGRPTTAYETPILRRDGDQRWVAWNAQRLDDFEGSPAVLAVGQDFTERRDAQERLLRSERLAGIGQMITGLAHESRNALQRIQACGEMLELEMAENEEALRLVRRSQEAQDHLRRLFDEVRGYAAPIQLERSPCRLETVWREAWNLLEAARRGRAATLVEKTADADLSVDVDRFRLLQLFRNLFENALAACTDPVVVQVLCRNVQFQQGDALEVRVKDNGPGLAPEVRRNVFEPFFTTKTKGTGLGMAIARRIVDAHGGQIRVGDGQQGGAEFVVTLPRSVL